MSRWPRDNVTAQIAFYGLPGPDIERQLVSVVPPFTMYYDKKPIKAIRFHRKCAPALEAALKEIWDHYGHSQATIDKLGISKYAGAYNPRPVRGYPLEADPHKTRWSNHAFAAAIDLNAEDNGFGKGKGTIPAPVIAAFKRQGARWGGDYRGRTDPMHFEFCDAGPAAPVAFVDLPPVDNDQDAEPVAPAAQPEQKSGFFGRVRNWVAAAATATGIGGTGVLTDWQIAAVVFGSVIFLIIASVTFIILFFGAEPVREWVRKHIT